MSSDDSLAWKEEGRRELLQTPVFTVSERRSTGPNGQSGNYIVNEAPDWVIVIPVVTDKFLMVRQWRHGERALSLEFPGGVIERGEEPAAGAARELMEETGATAGRLTHLATMNPNPALFDNHVHVYCAEDLSFSGSQHLDADEFVKYLEVPQAEVFAGMGHGEYLHALMASALCIYREIYGK